MQVKSIAECSKGSIPQYLPPSLSYHLSLRYLFCLFFSGRFTQVLLYSDFRQLRPLDNQNPIFLFLKLNTALKKGIPVARW